MRFFWNFRQKPKFLFFPSFSESPRFHLKWKGTVSFILHFYKFASLPKTMYHPLPPINPFQGQGGVMICFLNKVTSVFSFVCRHALDAGKFSSHMNGYRNNLYRKQKNNSR